MPARCDPGRPQTPTTRPANREHASTRQAAEAVNAGPGKDGVRPPFRVVLAAAILTSEKPQQPPRKGHPHDALELRSSHRERAGPGACRLLANDRVEAVVRCELEPALEWDEQQAPEPSVGRLLPSPTEAAACVHSAAREEIRHLVRPAAHFRIHEPRVMPHAGRRRKPTSPSHRPTAEAEVRSPRPLGRQGAVRSRRARCALTLMEQSR
jgi:hypothetical protein